MSKAMTAVTKRTPGQRRHFEVPSGDHEYRAEECCRVASAVARLNGTETDVAEALGVDLPTVRRWKKTHKNFAGALLAARTADDADVTRSLLKTALGFSYKTEKIIVSRGRAVVVSLEIHKPPNWKITHLFLRAVLPEIYAHGKVSRADANIAQVIASFLNKPARSVAVEGPKLSNEESYGAATTMARLAATHEEIAAAIGLTASAYEEMRASYSEFSDALEIGRSMLRQSLEVALARCAQGYSYSAERVFISRAGEVVRENVLKKVRANDKALEIWNFANPPK